MDSRELLKCFDLRYIVQALIAALVLVALALLGKRVPDGSAVRIAIGVAETLIFGYVVAITLMPIRELDELYQRIHLLAIAAAFGIVGFVGTGMVFLARAGLHPPSLGVWLWPLMVMSWGLGVWVIARRYR